MLEFSIHRNGSDLILELPIPTDVLAGELRMLGIDKTMNHITQDDFTLTPTNELGEHFMKLVKPDYTLGDIAVSCRELDVLAPESRQALVDLIMADRFRDLDHMHDYLQYGPDALHGLIRMSRDDRSVLLPTSQISIFQNFGLETPIPGILDIIVRYCYELAMHGLGILSNLL